MIKRLHHTGRTERRRSALLALFVASSFAVAACGGADTTVSAAPAEAEQEAASAFPQFTADTLDGSQIDFGSLEGQDSVLWFWAPW